MDTVRTAITLLGIYLAIGLPIAVAFVAVGVQHADPAARNAGLRFRLLILPGCVALWPLMLYLWKRGPRTESPPPMPVVNNAEAPTTNWTEAETVP